MKPKLVLYWTALILLAFQAVSCNYFFSSDDKDKACEDSRLTTTYEGMIAPCLIITRDLNYPDVNYNLCDATQIKVEGILSKVDCWDDEVDQQVISLVRLQPNPEEDTTPLCFGNFFVSFTNNNDFISVRYKITAYYSDGTTLKSDEVIETTPLFKFMVFQGPEHRLLWDLTQLPTMHTLK